MTILFEQLWKRLVFAAIFALGMVAMFPPSEWTAGDVYLLVLNLSILFYVVLGAPHGIPFGKERRRPEEVIGDDFRSMPDDRDGWALVRMRPRRVVDEVLWQGESLEGMPRDKDDDPDVILNKTTRSPAAMRIEDLEMFSQRLARALYLMRNPAEVAIKSDLQNWSAEILVEARRRGFRPDSGSEGDEPAAKTHLGVRTPYSAG